MGTYFVAETKNSIENAGKAIIIEAKNLTGAKIKATKLWKGNPELTATSCTMLMLGDHIDASGRIDHVLSIKHGEYSGTEPAWFDNDRWIERKEVEEESHNIPELSIGDTVKVIGDKFKRGNDVIGLTGFIYDEVEDEAGTFYTVEFNKPVGGYLRWDFMPEDLENMKEDAIMKKGNIGDTVIIVSVTQGQPEETVGQQGVITDIIHDPEGTFCTVEFNQPFHGWSRWDYKPTEIARHTKKA